MILPIKFLWEQLNGPQITAFSQYTFEFLKSIFDDKLEYFNNVTIENANDQHLTLLGLLSGLVRPTISEADRDYFYFTEEAEQNSVHGFASVDDPSIGGRLGNLGEGQGTHNVSLNAEHYRALLRAWVTGEGELGSLELMDDILYELTKLDLGADVEPFYEFHFLQGEDVPEARAQGDVFLDLGDMADWHNPLHVYAVLRGVAESVYAPVPQIFLSIGTENQAATPTASLDSGYSTDVYEDTVVSLSSSTANSSIYFTREFINNGHTEVLDKNVLYTEAFHFADEDKPGTYRITAYATAEGFAQSNKETWMYEYTS